MNPTPIETLASRKKDREDWRKHHEVMDAARAQGADFHCATMAGFAATDEPTTAPVFCKVCQCKGVAR
jgi:hypothetical protein